MDIIVNVDLEKFRWSLVGDGYIREEVVYMPEDELIEILKKRITDYITAEYDKSLRYGLLSDYEYD